MRALSILLALVSLPVSALNTIRFEPPAPSARTPILAHMRVGTGCPPSGATVEIRGRIISITVKQLPLCPAVPPPADGYPLTVDLGNVPPGTYDVVAGLDTILLLLAEGSLTVQDTNPGITLSPNVAPTSGDQVTIIRDSFECPDLCPPPVVTFGGKEAAFIRMESTNRIVVHAPEHDPGAVDVVVRFAGKTYIAIAAFNYFPESGGTDEAFFEPVLFPVVISGPGAAGSNWSTEVTLRNENDYTLPIFSIFDEVCFPVCDVRPEGHTTRLLTGINLPNGYLFNVPRQAAKHLSFGTLVRDLSRQAEALGTEIPVVREDDFFDDAFVLLNVPTDVRFRVALRLFRIDGGTSLMYDIRPMLADTPFVNDTVTLSPVAAGSTLTSAFIGNIVAKHPEFALKGPLRITIYAAPPFRATWAFVSVTNNQTQHVTVISPQ